MTAWCAWGGGGPTGGTTHSPGTTSHSSHLAVNGLPVSSVRIPSTVRFRYSGSGMPASTRRLCSMMHALTSGARRSNKTPNGRHSTPHVMIRMPNAARQGKARHGGMAAWRHGDLSEQPRTQRTTRTAGQSKLTADPTATSHHPPPPTPEQASIDGQARTDSPHSIGIRIELCTKS